MTSTLNRTYGWKPSIPDIRDLYHDFSAVDPASLPAAVDLRLALGSASRTFLPPVVDQGQLGSCTANMAAGALGFDEAAQNGVFDYAASRLFIYYFERSLEGTISSDSGASIADAAKVLNTNGAPPETDWPYDTTKFTDAPPASSVADGKTHEAVKYARVNQDANSIKACLAAGVPVCIGFTVYTTFEGSDTAATGVVTLPASGESTLGGHAVLVVGYLSGITLVTALAAAGKDTSKVDTTSGYWIVRNSWGTGWGDSGYFYMPESYLTNANLSSDFWTIQTVNSPDPAPVPPSPSPSPAPTPSPSPPAPVGTVTVTFTEDQIVAIDNWSDHPHVWHTATVAAKAWDEATKAV